MAIFFLTFPQKNFKGLKNQHLMLISEMKNAPKAKAAGALFSFLGKEETI